MKRGKHLKKVCLYFVLSMVLAASLTGCRRKVKLRSDIYSEWVDAIGINEYPHVSCESYYLYANGLSLTIGNFDSESAEEFKQIIDNHNEFVTRNPDYFPEDFDINISFRKGSHYIPLSFSNRTDSDLEKDYWSYIELPEIETEKTHRMRYAYPSDLDDINTKFEAETIIISIGTYMDGVEKAHDESEDFENFDTIVVKIPLEVEREIDVEEALKKIQRANPDAEIYYKTYSNELRKYVPDEKSN